MFTNTNKRKFDTGANCDLEMSTSNVKDDARKACLELFPEKSLNYSNKGVKLMIPPSESLLLANFWRNLTNSRLRPVCSGNTEVH